MLQGGDHGRASLVGMHEPAQNAAMQDAMQLMFGADGTAMQFPLPSMAQQEQEQEQGSPSNKPALMQRLSVLARGPADSPSYRPFNMLAGPDASTSFSQPVAYLRQSQNEAAGLTPAQYSLPQAYLPPAACAIGACADVGGASQVSQPGQPCLSMTGVVTDALSTQEPWLSPEPLPTHQATRKGRKHSTAAGAKHDKSKAGQLHAISESASEVERHNAEREVQSEFSFSPLGDSSSRIQDIAFSPLAAGAGQVQARPSVAQRIRTSLFGPARGGGKSTDLNHVKVSYLVLVTDC